METGSRDQKCRESGSREQESRDQKCGESRNWEHESRESERSRRVEE